MFNYRDSCEAIGKTPSKNLEPLSLFEFSTYLENKKVFPKQPNAFRIIELLRRMTTVGLLHNSGNRGGDTPIFGDRYWFFNPYSSHRDKGFFWLASAIGSDFLFHMVAPGIVQITGTDEKGSARAGTGLIISENHILTCRHVVCDMTIDSVQNFQDIKCTINKNSIKSHDDHDVAVINTDTTLRPVPGLVFLQPVISQNIYTIGFPKIPFTKTASLTMQPGAITSESVESLSGETLFLYSAVARPGNSGGPVISQDGYIVGMTLRI